MVLKRRRRNGIIDSGDEASYSSSDEEDITRDLKRLRDGAPENKALAKAMMMKAQEMEEEPNQIDETQAEEEEEEEEEQEEHVEAPVVPSPSATNKTDSENSVESTEFDCTKAFRYKDGGWFFKYHGKHNKANGMESFYAARDVRSVTIYSNSERCYVEIAVIVPASMVIDPKDPFKEVTKVYKFEMIDNHRPEYEPRGSTQLKFN